MFSLDEAVNQHPVQFFVYKDRFFYVWGTIKLTEIWQNIIEKKRAIYWWLIFVLYVKETTEKHKKYVMTFLTTQ